MFDKVQLFSFPGRRRQGFTIVEIVVAFIIIGILTLVMVPVLTKQSEQARINACEQDLQHLADAQERACVDTGYLYRPYVLNDVIYGDAIPNAFKQLQLPGTGNENRVNGIRDNGSAYTTPLPLYQNASIIFISPNTQNYLDPGIESSLFERLTGSPDGRLGVYFNAETNFRWNGPYINWRRDGNLNDWPEDPWGHDYIFFTKAGMLYPPIPEPSSGPTTPPGSGGSDPYTDTSYIFQMEGPEYDIGGSPYRFKSVDTKGNQLFDRPTWLSLGPNGLPGNGSIVDTDPDYGYGTGDDITRKF